MAPSLSTVRGGEKEHLTPNLARHGVQMVEGTAYKPATAAWSSIRGPAYNTFRHRGVTMAAARGHGGGSVNVQVILRCR